MTTHVPQIFITDSIDLIQDFVFFFRKILFQLWYLDSLLLQFVFCSLDRHRFWVCKTISTYWSSYRSCSSSDCVKFNSITHFKHYIFELANASSLDLNTANLMLRCSLCLNLLTCFGFIWFKNNFFTCFRQLWLNFTSLAVLGLTFAFAVVPIYERLITYTKQAGYPDNMSTMSSLGSLFWSAYSAG